MPTKTILITGASAGFGEEIAKLLSKEKHRLILVARRLEKLESLQSQLNTQTYIKAVDVTKKSQVKELFENLPVEFRDIDVLINNAGLALGINKAPETTLEDWETMIDTNNKGLVMVTHFALQIMKKRNSGLIVNIGSVAGTAPYPGGNVYGATKAFVRQFSRNLRADLNGTNIKVSNIEPGAAETEFSIVRFHGNRDQAKKVYENTRALEAVDIANTVKWIMEQPMRVNIDNIEIMPIDQTYAGLTTFRKSQE